MALTARPGTLLPLLLLAGCTRASDHSVGTDAGTVGDARTTAPASSTSAAPLASAASAGASVPRYLVFTDRAKHHLAIERSGTSVRAVLDNGTRLELVGKMTDETHFALHATKGVNGDKPMKLTGELGAASLKATLVDGTGKKDDASWTPGTALPATLESELLGRVGKAFIRMKLTASAGTIAGTYRYAASPSDLQLAGTLRDDGSFEMIETSKGKPTGTITGVLASPDALLGQWRSPDGSRTAPFVAEQGAGYPSSASFDDGIELFPQEKLVEGKRCKVDIVFPQLRGGKDPKASKAVNDYLRGEGSKVRTCEGPGPEEPDMMDYETSESYALDTKAGRFIGIHRDAFEFAGGAHGMYGSECLVVDTKTLQHFKLATRLTEGGRAKLGALVVASLAKQQEVGKLTEAGYGSDTIEITKDTDVCLRSDGIEVSFDPYEIGPYSLGPSSAKITMAQAKPLFVKDEVTTALFGK